MLSIQSLGSDSDSGTIISFLVVLKAIFHHGTPSLLEIALTGSARLSPFLLCSLHSLWTQIGNMIFPSRHAVINAFFLRLAYATPAFAPAGNPSAGHLEVRNLRQGSHISNSDYATVTVEYLAGQDIANKAKTLINEDNYYYELFIPSQYVSEGQANEYNNVFLTKFVDLGGDSSYTVTIDYIGTSNDPKCQQSSQPGYLPYAYTEDMTITLCDAFFQQPSTSGMTCDSQYLDEYETGAMTLLHEFTHLSPAYFSLTETPNPPFQDFVYGSANCRDLASARTSASQAIVNADNWMFVTLGAYWSNKCGKQIEPDDPDTGVYDGIDGQAPSCLLGSADEWLISAGGSCNAQGVASNGMTSGGPGGCGIPNTGGMNGVNVADYWVLPQGTTAIEITLEVSNKT